MSTTKEALEAIGAEVTALEELSAKVEGHLVQVRENLHAHAECLGRIELRCESIETKLDQVIEVLKKTVDNQSEHRSHVIGAIDALGTRVRKIEAGVR